MWYISQNHLPKQNYFKINLFPQGNYTGKQIHIDKKTNKHIRNLYIGIFEGDFFCYCFKFEIGI